VLLPLLYQCASIEVEALCYQKRFEKEVAKALADLLRFLKTKTKRLFFSPIATWVVSRRRVALWEGRLSTDVATSADDGAFCLPEYRDLLLTANTVFSRMCFLKGFGADNGRSAFLNKPLTGETEADWGWVRVGPGLARGGQ